MASLKEEVQKLLDENQLKIEKLRDNPDDIIQGYATGKKDALSEIMKIIDKSQE